MRKKLVYCGGTFDLFHPGHVELLRRASLLGSVCAVVNTDRYVLELKKKPPVMNQNERWLMLDACKYVDSVVYCDGDERGLIDFIKPDILYYGNDGSYSRESYLALFGVDETWLEANGVELIFAGQTDGVSSSDIKQRCVNAVYRDAYR